MARVDMVTRELVGTQAHVLLVDLDTNTTKEGDYTLKGKYKTAEGLLKALKKAYNTETVQIVKVISFAPVHKLYGMKSEDFYSHAIELNTETRKPLESEDK